jgi:hypothetical protein
LPPSEELYQVLIRKYFDKGNIREINYFIFCQDIDRAEDLFSVYVPKNKVDERSFAPGELRNAGSHHFKDSTLNLDIISNRFQQ